MWQNMNFDIEETAYPITIINKTNKLKYYVWIYSSIHGATRTTEHAYNFYKKGRNPFNKRKLRQEL